MQAWQERSESAATKPKKMESAMAVVIVPDPSFVPVAFYVPLSFQRVNPFVPLVFPGHDLRVDFLAKLR